MRGHRIALVASGRQHHRRPEVAHRRKVRSPIAGDRAIENRSKLRVGADPGVELIYQTPDSILREPIDPHDRLHHTVGATATTTIAIQSGGVTGCQRASEVSLAKELARRIAPSKGNDASDSSREKHASRTSYPALAIKQYLKYMISSPARENRLRLTVYTDYALRLLMYLALKDDGLATIAEVAESYGISKNHLMKVAHQLGVAGYVATVRGRSGGLRLAKPAEAIGLGEVVRHTEPDMALVSCFKPVNAPCAIQQCCVLQSALEKAWLAFVEVLDGYTLSDLVKPRARLRALLSIAPGRVPAPAGMRSSKRAKAGRQG